MPGSFLSKWEGGTGLRRNGARGRGAGWGALSGDQCLGVDHIIKFGCHLGVTVEARRRQLAWEAEVRRETQRRDTRGSHTMTPTGVQTGRGADREGRVTWSPERVKATEGPASVGRGSAEGWGCPQPHLPSGIAHRDLLHL